MDFAEKPLLNLLDCQITTLIKQLEANGEQMRGLIETLRLVTKISGDSSHAGKSALHATNATDKAATSAEMTASALFTAPGKDQQPELQKQVREIAQLKGALSEAQEESRNLKEEIAREMDRSRYLQRELEKYDAVKEKDIDTFKNQIAGLENKIAQLTESLACEKKKNDEIRQNLEKKLSENRQESGSLREALGTMREQLAALEMERKQKENELAALREDTLLDLDNLKKIESALLELPPRFLDVLKKYYQTDNLPIFLVQCGQFNRLEQFWQSCRDLTRLGEDFSGQKSFLELLLDLYNNSSPTNPGKRIIAEPGAIYDYNHQERVGENGTKVRFLLLPGLIQPNGAIAVKAMVKLG